MPLKPSMVVDDESCEFGDEQGRDRLRMTDLLRCGCGCGLSCERAVCRACSVLTAVKFERLRRDRGIDLESRLSRLLGPWESGSRVGVWRSRSRLGAVGRESADHVL